MKYYYAVLTCGFGYMTTISTGNAEIIWAVYTATAAAVASVYACRDDILKKFL